MSIEVLTRRIERLKHHIQLLDGVRDDDGRDHATRISDLGPVLDHKRRGGSGGTASMMAVQRHAGNTTMPHRLPNASFGGGASLVSRQRQALAQAVQQAATRGVTQIRDELQSQEVALYDILLEKYVALCDGLMEAPDAQFFGSEDSIVTTRPPSATASSSQAQTPDFRRGSSSDGVDATHPQAAIEHHHSPYGDPSDASHVTQRSHSVVGLDSNQRSRNTKVEQLAVACQVLLSRRRRFDILDAKMRDFDHAVLRFDEVLADCHRLWRKSASTCSIPASSTHPQQTANSAAVGPAPTANRGATRLAPIGTALQGSAARHSVSPGRDTHSAAAHDAPQLSPRASKAASITDDKSSSLKILHAKVNDAQADVRGAAVRLLLYLLDIITEAEEQRTSAAVVKDQPMRRTMPPISTVLLERKQASLLERLTRHCQHIRASFGDAPEFCPPSLGIICSTPLLMDVSLFSAQGEGGTRGGTRGVLSRAGSSDQAAVLPGDIPVAQHRRKSVSASEPIDASDGSRRPSLLLGGMTRKSLSSATSAPRQPLIIPRSVKETEMQNVHKAYDAWLSLANLLSIDVPPTAVPFAKRFVPSGDRPSTPNVFLRHPVIDAYNPGMLSGVTAVAGKMYCDADMYGFAPYQQTPNNVRVDAGEKWRTTTTTHADDFTTTEQSVISAAAEAAITAISSQPSSPLRLRETATPPSSPREDAPSPTTDASILDSTAHVSAVHLVCPHTSHVAVTEKSPLVHVHAAGDEEPMKRISDQFGEDSRTANPKRGTNPVGVRDMWRARRNLQNACLHESPSKQSSAPTSCSEEPIDSRNARLHEIADRLHRLEAQRTIFKFARGFVVNSRRLNAQGDHTTTSIDELSVVGETREADKEKTDDWASETEMEGLSNALSQRDAAVQQREQHAAATIVRFLRSIVSSRINRRRCDEQRSRRRFRCAVRAIETWWSVTVPRRRARQHASRHMHQLRRARYCERQQQFDAILSAIDRLQCVGRAYMARHQLGLHYPARMLDIQKNAISRALWFREAQKEASTYREIHSAGTSAKKKTQLRLRAAIRLQAFARGIIARNLVCSIKSRQLVERRLHGGPTNQERVRAARIIQRGWRCHLARIAMAATRREGQDKQSDRRLFAAREWALEKISGFVRIVEAKRDTQVLRQSVAAREKEERKRSRDPSRRRAEISAALLCAKMRMQQVVDRADTNKFFFDNVAEQEEKLRREGKPVPASSSSALAQRQLHRILNVDHATVPKLDLEGNFLSNVSDASKTIEREEDSLEVRLLHRLLQAPIPLLYVFHNFIVGGGARDNPSVAPAAHAQNDFSAIAPQGERTMIENSFAVSRQDGVVDAPGQPRSTETTPAEECLTSGAPRCLVDEMDDDHSASDVEEGSPLAREPHAAAITPQSAVWRAKQICSSRLTFRSHDELLLEDRDGVPRAPPTTEPFARWSIAHAVVQRVFDEAALFAWKMIFSHTVHDAQKQLALTTDEEREARLGRVQQRNMLILACYDCETEKDWLAQARKNIGFVGKIWSPIRYLDGGDSTSEEDLEERALQSYRFTDDFLLQCFPNAYSLRDVPELLVSCGIYRVLKKAVEEPFKHLSRVAPAEPVRVDIKRSRIQEDIKAHLMSGRRNGEHLSTMSPPVSSSCGPSLVEMQFHSFAEQCGLRCLETLVQLQKLSDGCLSPTITTVPSHRPRNTRDDDEEVEVSRISGDDDYDDDEDDEREYGCDDESNPPRSVSSIGGNLHGRDTDEERPDRSETRLGFIDDHEPDSSDAADGNINEHGTTPSTTTSHTHQRFPVHVESVRETELGESETPASGLSDSGRDEALARQILLEQPGGPLDTPEEYPPLSNRAVDDDDADQENLERTGRGNHLPPRGDDSDEDSAETDGHDEAAFFAGLTVQFNSDSTSPPVVQIEMSGALEMLAERLAVTLTDTRADPLMFEDV